jgi:electron transport complex protein RnfB
VCPVDCIALENASGDRTGWAAWSEEQAQQALARYEWHRERGERATREQNERLARKAEAKLADLPGQTHGAEGAEADRKRAVIEAALARARARRANG